MALFRLRGSPEPKILPHTDALAGGIPDQALQLSLSFWNYIYLLRNPSVVGKWNVAFLAFDSMWIWDLMTVLLQTQGVGSKPNLTGINMPLSVGLGGKL